MTETKKPTPTLVLGTAVESSQIDQIGYCPETKILAVEFKSNSTYLYANVPAETYEGLRTAESVGKFFNANVKTSFPYTKYQYISRDRPETAG